ncbi:secreted RxLR effector protein 161-like [Hevea brasiliensis]|uniref:secreted RxLR effector protein 161-like n=1 Tax=Hevea brasiliensis TaxID=3981 RepID=UPI0025E9E944|nr:secreted RxLR effector protein 161-like [Hevea brasiliensis]
MYAYVYIRPDIAYVVSVLSRYLSNPRPMHWVTVKKVLRYLQKTKDYMLIYKQVDHLEIVGHSNSDFVGCYDDLKSTSRYVFMFIGGAISWKSVKQTLIASSTMQAEFVAYYGAATRAVWLKNFVSGLLVVDSISKPLPIYYDNSAAVFFSKNNKSNSGSKHLEIKYLTV